DTLGSSRLGELASDVLFVWPNQQNGLLNLLVAKKIEVHMPTEEATTEECCIKAEELTAWLRGSEDHGFMLENIAALETPLENWTPSIRNKVQILHSDHLNLKSLLRYLK